MDKAARSKTGVWKMQEWTHWHNVARVDIAGVDNAAPCCRGGQCGSGQCRSGQMPVKMCSRQVVSRRLYVRSTAALNDHLRGDSDDNDDGADEDVAQMTDQTQPQDAAITSEPATRASDDCCEVCLINRKAHGTRPKFSAQELVPETWIVCHTFWYQIFRVPETWIEWDQALFCTRNLEARDSNTCLSLVAEVC